MQKNKKYPAFDLMGLLTQHKTRWTVSQYKENQMVCAQGDPADSVFLYPQGQDQTYRRVHAWEGSRRCNPGTG